MLIVKCSSEEKVTLKLLELFEEKANEFLMHKKYINIAIATGNTFSAFSKHFSELLLPFERMNLFVVDEYAGVDCTDERSCTIDLCQNIQIISKFHNTYFYDADKYRKQVAEYNEIIKRDPIDILLLGIGADGHFAFCNDAETAKHADPITIIHFSKEDIAKQVEYGWFSNINEVPKEGITLTSTGVLKSKAIIMAGFSLQKSEILDSIIQGTVSDTTPIKTIINREDIILVFD